MALNLNKAADNFLHIYDNLLSDKWCDMMYQYALKKGRPWGAYVTIGDVLNSEISTEEVLDDDPERAMSLEAVRSYFAQKGTYFLKDDQQRIHGISTRFRAIHDICSDISNFRLCGVVLVLGSDE